jgi:hypothetical protein
MKFGSLRLLHSPEVAGTVPIRIVRPGCDLGQVGRICTTGQPRCDVGHEPKSSHLPWQRAFVCAIVVLSHVFCLEPQLEVTMD